MTITIYHNPQCGTSRNTLALIRNTGAEPEVIEYLVNPPSRNKLVVSGSSTPSSIEVPPADDTSAAMVSMLARQIARSGIK